MLATKHGKLEHNIGAIMKSVLSIIVANVILVMGLAATVRATVIYVSGDQTGTWSADTVIVTAEVRVPPGQSLIILPGVEVLFQVYCKLIVDNGATLLAVGTLADSIRFDGLSGSSWHGIRFLSASDSSRLEYCYLTHGSATGSGEDIKGGAIYCFRSSPSISGNTIRGNSAHDGGAIYCGNSSPTISGNTISGNSATGTWSMGGGIYCESSNSVIIGNTISGNSAYIRGGGIYCVSSSPSIIGNTITENSVVYAFGGGIACNSSNPTLVNCILWGDSPQEIYLDSGNLQASYCDIQGGFPGEGNIGLDPLFVDPANGDYHLQSTVGSFHGGSWLPDSLYSPCIDAGDPGSPFALEPMPNGGRINMGFEGNTLEASLSTSTWVIYVSGDQTGTWSADTVIVTAEVRVPPGQSLTILPGVEVLFQVYCKFIVDSAATLLAVGTSSDSIRFDVLPPDTAWHGIRFLFASDSSRLEYCYLTHGNASGEGEDANGGAIYCSSSSPTISHNTISGNSTFFYYPHYAAGGGIYCYNSNPTICNNTISANSALNGGAIYCEYNSNPNISDNNLSVNTAFTMGGGICCSESNPIINGNTISRNSVTGGDDGSGGGICCLNSNPIISGNIISLNSATVGGEGVGGGICCINSNSIITGNNFSGNSSNFGGGIFCDDSNAIISGNMISGNITTEGGGGGVSCAGGSPAITGNTISGNSAFYGGGICCQYLSSPIISGNIIIRNSASSPFYYEEGGGVYCNNSSPTISCNTISGNSASDWGGGIYCDNSSPTLVNCILWGNSLQQIYQDSTSNLQAIYSDIQDTLWPGMGNINLDPLFVDPENNDYHLQSTVGSFHGGSWLPDSLYSHCIDAGDPGSPFALEPMPNGGRINMGFEGNTLEASLSTSSAVPLPIAELPKEFHLYAPYPNPFNPSTEITYNLSNAGHVSLCVFDLLGRKVAILVNGFANAGSHRVTFDGSHLPSGIYFAHLQAGDHSESCKMVLLK
jgi:hypothetical protein